MTLFRFKIKLLLILSCMFPVISMAKTTATTTQPVANVSTLPPCTIYPEGQKLYDKYNYGVLYYYGFTVDNSLLQTMTLMHLRRWPEHIQSLELSHTLDEDNPVRQFFSPLVGIVQVAGDFTVRNGSNEPTIYEFAPYIGWRWANLPWNHYVNTSLSLGEGVSYVSSVPAIEKNDNDDSKRLLNYLMFEATFASPDYPRLQFVARVHHRSGAYGLYGAGNSGSNDIGLGIRYLFD